MPVKRSNAAADAAPTDGIPSDAKPISKGLRAKIAKRNKGFYSGPASSIPERERLMTGIASVDYALRGGLPMGGYTHIWGQFSSGKTNFALMAIAAAQRKYPDRTAVFFDLEHQLDAAWAAKLGVDVDALEVIRPDHADQAADMIADICLEDDLSFFVVDSIGAFLGERESEKEVSDAIVGGQSMLVSQMVKRIVNNLTPHKHRVAPAGGILLNQRRNKIGVMFGSNENAPGGNALNHFALVNLKMFGKQVKDDKLHPTLPVFHESSFTVGKYKIRINEVNFSLNLCITDNSTYSVGDVDNARPLTARLKAQDKLYKEGKAYKIDGTDIEVRTIKELQEMIKQDSMVYNKIMGLVLDGA